MTWKREGRTIYGPVAGSLPAWSLTVQNCHTLGWNPEDGWHGQHGITSNAELLAIATLIHAAPDLRRLLASIIARNKTPDATVERDVAEARALLRELEER